ncbi:MAG: hypothetical protein HKO85_11205 [Xanthomonadales bacterium]|nr:hypothetical protein [Gammaproteobacteria bacterium]MBT8051508.1 hypothetical protein [Gammaproteobacteria bacterium]NNJ80164.1 hypothetical protein [Xanthomonadales bacterium]NNL05845.1 hypothetical protein [Xanthomonadales bacterium]
MIGLIIAFGMFIAVAGMAMLIRPAFVIGMIQTHGGRVWVYALAIGIRAVLGLVLIQQAAYSKFPLTVSALGWISLLAALSLAALGRRRFTRLIYWIIAKVGPFAPVGGLLAVLLGAFLVYAFT